MSGLFRSTTIKGTRITDFAKTSADVGSTIPFLYGRVPVTGNVIFAALPPKENRQVKRQGKGGVKQETFTYTTSYAISFCRGPIQGYWWIKRNGKVVYSQDPAAPIEDKDYAAKWAAKVMMYNGTSSQMPSSMIEAIKGTGRVSAFRYLAYIAVPDEDVTDGGGAIPSYEAVPIASPAEVWITSTPYAQIFYDNARAGLAPTGGELVQLLFESDMQDDNVVVGLAPTGGVLYQPPPQNFYDAATAGLAPTGGELKRPPPQNFKDASTAALAPTGGTLKVPPIGMMQAENVAVGFGPTGGELQTAIATYVVSLLHFDGTDGATSTVDQIGLTWTLVGNAHLDTARAEFGASALLLDGSGDYAWASDPTLNLGGGDYTVEGWAYYDSTNYGAYRAIFSTFSAQQYGRIFVLIEPDGDLFYGEQGPYGSPNFGGATATKAPFQTWFHWAAVRSGTTLRLFKDGVKIGEWTNQSVSNNFAGHFRVGRLDSGSYEFGWLGSIDELRITKGVALYTEDFIPPNAPFPNP